MSVIGTDLIEYKRGYWNNVAQSVPLQAILTAEPELDIIDNKNPIIGSSGNFFPSKLLRFERVRFHTTWFIYGLFLIQ